MEAQNFKEVSKNCLKTTASGKSRFGICFPPLAENAHMLINRMAKTMMTASKLPYKYYQHAMKTAIYLKNRYGDPSRYEKLLGKKPRTDRLVSFGTIGYCFVPVEKREMGKHDLTKREKCRVIGYGDVDESEEMFAYQVLLESDGRIIYSNDVIFKGEPATRFQPTETIENHEDEYGEITMDLSGIGNDQEDLNVENEHGDPDENLFSNEDDFPETTTRRQGRRFTPDDFDSESGSEYLNSTTPSESVQDETILVTSEELIPTTEKEALNAKESEKWIEAME